ncbi:hypothetical protein ILUMI_27204 [Ignelater luminosus]|uniref:Amino acid transporter transmembrane domain-containing protein n=1 Tax=Ignelater luminosus TaxID=2038154 RepID=A0A8K0C8E2_IGNLU|nr:hypothetical protein ILUMI_27204 [Ignelater luminosus]
MGICCVYVVFIAANVQSVANIHIKEMGIEIYMLIFLIPLILINWIKDLKRLAPFSTAANAITLVSFGIILYYVITEKPSFDNKELVGKAENIPLFLGTVLFSLEAIGVIMPLENEMKTPKAFGGPLGVLNIGMGTIVFLYLGMGLLGYLTYGHAVEGTITLNLPKEDVLAQVVKVSLALAIFITYGLQCYVAVDITWNGYLGPKLEKNSKKVLWEYVTRTVLVLITFGIAVLVPALDLFISLFGAFCLSALGIAIPAAIETCTYWYSRSGASFYIMLIKNLALIIFGICGLFAGTYSSLRDIIKEFS